MRLDELNLDAVPEPMRQQIAAKVALDHVQRRKYGNKPTTMGGIRYDSQKEAQRGQELIFLFKREVISDLRLQPEFTLQEAFTKPDGERVRAIRYRADFSYVRDGRLVIEDVKSEATRQDKTYRLKRKMMEEKGYCVKEV